MGRFATVILAIALHSGFVFAGQSQLLANQTCSYIETMVKQHGNWSLQQIMNEFPGIRLTEDKGDVIAWHAKPECTVGFFSENDLWAGPYVAWEPGRLATCGQLQDVVPSRWKGDDMRASFPNAELVSNDKGQWFAVRDLAPQQCAVFFELRDADWNGPYLITGSDYIARRQAEEEARRQKQAPAPQKKSSWMEMFENMTRGLVYGDGAPTQSRPSPPKPKLLDPPIEPTYSAPVYSGAMIQGRIAGTFEGWTGGTQFQLDNGQLWQQTDSSYHYHSAYRPSVTITRTGNGGYMMTVDRVPGAISVIRLK